MKFTFNPSGKTVANQMVSRFGRWTLIMPCSKESDFKILLNTFLHSTELSLPFMILYLHLTLV